MLTSKIGMLFKYEATTLEGERQNGVIDAVNMDVAVNSLQRKNLIIVSIDSAEKKSFLEDIQISVFKRIKKRDVVILSRQLATLFESKVSVTDSFKLLAEESESPVLREKLNAILEDIQGGLPMSQAMGKHSDVFSRFYVNMVKSGEESGRLDEVFVYLADYLERAYDLISKARNALFYPAFIVATFIAVMSLMMVVVIPKLQGVLEEAGQEIPFYTKIIIAISEFLSAYGIILLVLLGGVIAFLIYYGRTEPGRLMFSQIEITVPVVGNLYKKLYISRITDNLQTLLSSGISMTRSLEITAEVVGNRVYENILTDSVDALKAGNSVSEIFSKYEEIPPLVSHMIKIGEESGKLNFILGTLAKFYKREVDNAVETLVSLIEPIMIIVLAIAVGILLVAIIGPIYSITAAF